MNACHFSHVIDAGGSQKSIPTLYNDIVVFRQPFRYFELISRMPPTRQKRTQCQRKRDTLGKSSLVTRMAASYSTE